MTTSDLALREKGRFKPGVSGNKGGRPKLAPAIRDACRDATADVIKQLKTEVKKKGPDWLAAAKLLMAYGWGSPSASVEITRPDDPTPPANVRLDAKRLTKEELEATMVLHRAYKRLQAEDAPEGAISELVAPAQLEPAK